MATLFPSNVITFRSGNIEQRPGTLKIDDIEKLKSAKDNHLPQPSYLALIFFYVCVFFLTGTIPLRTALVSVDQDGKTEKAAVWRVRGEGAALGLVEQDKLVVDADVLCALINDLCIWRLEKTK